MMGIATRKLWKSRTDREKDRKHRNYCTKVELVAFGDIFRLLRPPPRLWHISQSQLSSLLIHSTTALHPASHPPERQVTAPEAHIYPRIEASKHPRIQRRPLFQHRARQSWRAGNLHLNSFADRPRSARLAE